MHVDLLKYFVESLYDKQTLPVIELLLKKKDVNEFLIAKKLKLTIHQTRNILYKLSSNNLVSSTRKKDKKKGWYIYYWTLNYRITLEFLKKRLEKEAEQLMHQIRSREIKRFYHCNTCNVEVSEETALINNFTCRECGEVFQISENKKFIKEMTSRLEKVKKEIGDLDKEIAEIGEKDRKKSARVEKSNKVNKKSKERVKKYKKHNKKTETKKKASKSAKKKKSVKKSQRKIAAKKTAKKPMKNLSKKSKKKKRVLKAHKKKFRKKSRK